MHSLAQAKLTDEFLFQNKAEHAVQSNAAGKGCIILPRNADQC